MPLFFWWVEGVNCVVHGSLTLLRPQRYCASAPTAQSHGSHFVPKCPRWKAWLRMPWKVCHRSCLPLFVFAAALTGLLLTAESEQGDGKSELWVPWRPVAQPTVYMELLLETLSLESYEHTAYPCAFFMPDLSSWFCPPPSQNHMTIICPDRVSEPLVGFNLRLLTVFCLV